MRLGLLADVHANAIALEAVLDDVRRVGVDQVVVLGDLVGYNAEPKECVDRLRALDAIIVRGNHDEDVANEPKETTSANKSARTAQAWTRERLDQDRRAWLGALPNRYIGEGFVAVHGCFLNDDHTWGYVTSTMLEANLASLEERGWPRLAFVGHTHVQTVGFRLQGRVLEIPYPTELTLPAHAGPVILNPGSVGQPRDRDPRAAWAVVDVEAGRFDPRRVPYDTEAAAERVRAAGLPDENADRLSRGR